MLRNAGRTALKVARAYALQGDRYYCPVCDRHFRSFLPGGTSRRRQVRCPNCDSLERHRLLWLALQNLLDTDSTGKKLLHVAPEPCLANRLKQQYDYLSVDMEAANAMQQMDICQIPLPDATFDAILCNHVLEHIPNDMQALKELFRVLKPKGWASIQVPISGEQTQEDLSITDPQIRATLYGQSDHVRQYGRDFQQRLKSTGFEVDIVSKADLVNSKTLQKLSLDSEDEVWICRK
ncbi:MAG: methyltransferase domain-containing protein [Acaryochloridaceae cyanobacterium SU_2_1]|nr:methyltransferase domain-containing protein [Acaryochloridaceae cyanobacterium SU_2_1]